MPSPRLMAMLTCGKQNLERVRIPYRGVPFTRDCHYQCWMACIATKDGRGGSLYCAIVWAMKGVGGVPRHGGLSRIIALYLVQRSRTERTSCKSQTVADRGRTMRLANWSLQDILLLLVVCARINRPFILPARLHCRTVSTLLHDYWAIYYPPPRHSFCVPYTLQYW